MHAAPLRAPRHCWVAAGMLGTAGPEQCDLYGLPRPASLPNWPEAPWPDLPSLAALCCRVRGDGRQYIASVRCENWLVDERSHDVWQAFLFAR